MPLQLFLGKAQAKQVYQTGIRLIGQYRYDVGMGRFAVANDPVNPTALGTSGALPCQIIVVHKAPGHGALGHYAAHSDPLMIVRGVQRMVQQLGEGPISDVVLAAGMIGGDQVQQAYENAVCDGVRAACPGARVVWPAVPPDDVWGACYYLPLVEQVGLLADSPGTFVGEGDEHGIAVQQY